MLRPAGIALMLTIVAMGRVAWIYIFASARQVARGDGVLAAKTAS